MRIAVRAPGLFESKRLLVLTTLCSLGASLASACALGRPYDLFEVADRIFLIQELDLADCKAASAEIPPELRLTRAGIKWHADGQMIDFLLEYGQVAEYKRGTLSAVAFIDKANPVFETKIYDYPRSWHARARIIAEVGLDGSGSIRASDWVMDDELNWAESKVEDVHERVEVNGNQVRISVPASLLQLSGRSDPRVTDWAWLAITGSEPYSDACVEAPADSPWPLSDGPWQRIVDAINATSS